MKKVLVLNAVILAVLLLVQSIIWAQAEDNENDAVKALRLLEKKYKETKTFTGEFTQVKKAEVFLEEIKSAGKYYYKKPKSFRCDYLSKEKGNSLESENLFVNDTAWVYVTELKQVEKYYIGSEDNSGGGVNQMLIGFGVSTDKLLKEYYITIKDSTESSVGALLVPKKNYQGNQIKNVVLWINKEKVQPERFIITEKNGDVTEITLTNINVNVKIDDSLFEPKFPKGVEIIDQE